MIDLSTIYDWQWWLFLAMTGIFVWEFAIKKDWQWALVFAVLIISHADAWYVPLWPYVATPP